MARMTKAQREWRPGMRKKHRSVRVMFGSTVLTLEAFVVLFATMGIAGLYGDRIPVPATLAGGLALAGLCIGTCALLKRPAGVRIGWAIQLALVLLGFIEPLMFVVGALFAAAWAYALVKGRALDVENARREREQLEWERAHPREGGGPGGQAPPAGSV